MFGAHFTKLIPKFNLEQQNRSLLTKVLDKDYPVKINVNSRGESVWRESYSSKNSQKFSIHSKNKTGAEGLKWQIKDDAKMDVYKGQRF